MVKDLLHKIDEFNKELKIIEQNENEYEALFNDYSILMGLVNQIENKLKLADSYFLAKKPNKVWEKYKMYKHFDTQNGLNEEYTNLKIKKENILVKANEIKGKVQELELNLTRRSEIEKQKDELNKQIDELVLASNSIEFRMTYASLLEIRPKKCLVEGLLSKGKYIKKSLMYLKGQLDYLTKIQRYDYLELFTAIKSDFQKGKVKKLIYEFNQEIASISNEMTIPFKPKLEAYIDINIFQVKRTDSNIQKINIAAWNLEEILKELHIMYEELKNKEQTLLNKRYKIIAENFID